MVTDAFLPRDTDIALPITEVADRAGVSIATVSRVVSGRGRVREACPGGPQADRPGRERPLDQRLPTHLVIRASSAA